MKFLFVTPRSHPERYGWVKSLHDHGHDITIFVWKVSELENSTVVTSEYIGDGGFIERIARMFGIQGSTFFQKYKGFFKPLFSYKKLKECNPDVVILHNPHLFPTSFIFAVCARLQGRRTLFYVQTTLYKKDLGSLKKFGISLVTKLFNAQWVTPIIGKEGKYSRFNSRAFFVPLVVEPAEKRTEHSGDRKIVNIITVAKLTYPRKNILLLLQALTELRNNISFHLTLVGSLPDKTGVYYRKILHFIEDHGLQNNVTIKSNVPPAQMRDEYTQHDLFILPSTDEPFGVSVLEAMGCGLPVICSNTAGVRWYVKNGENGFSFIDNDLQSLKETIKTVTEDTEKMQKMGEQSLELVRSRYSPEVFYETFTGVLQQ